MEFRQIKNIQEDVNDYIENCQEPDFIENEFIYADINGLEEMLLDVSLVFRLKSLTSLQLSSIFVVASYRFKKHPHTMFSRELFSI